jgi:hypothetical protein
MSCGHRLGYLPNRFTVTAVTPDGDQWQALADPDHRYLFCDNARYEACNWLVPAEDGAALCRSCRHNRTVPDLDQPENLTAWRKLEQAKRHLMYSLMRWRLPHPTHDEDPAAGLVFDALAGSESAPVLTGHEHGVITINIAEADDAEREARRTAMGEPYRTLLGHLRHEVGHYYWDRLVHDGGRLERCRQEFGDESQDYAAALKRHYDGGPAAAWQNSFISAYASAHPWEDFAETWAHYVHIVDSLETARSFGITVRPVVATADTLDAEVDFDPYRHGSVDDLVSAWVPMTLAINSVNRSMGQPDLYPFVLSTPVLAKLGFIHDIVRHEARRETGRAG